MSLQEVLTLLMLVFQALTYIDSRNHHDNKKK